MEVDREVQMGKACQKRRVAILVSRESREG